MWVTGMKHVARFTFLTEKRDSMAQEVFIMVSYFQKPIQSANSLDKENFINSNLDKHFFSDITTRDIEISRLARQFYFGEEITEDDLKQFINLNSDVQFWFGTDKLINYLSPHVPVFHYILYFQDMFSFTINPNTLGKVGITLVSDLFPCIFFWHQDLGVGHADDLAYMWDIFSLNMESGLYDIWWSDADKLNSRRSVGFRLQNIHILRWIYTWYWHVDHLCPWRMLELWSNFIKYGDPTPTGQDSEALQGVEWAPVTQGSHQYLRHGYIFFYVQVHAFPFHP